MLGISRAAFYYQPVEKPHDNVLVEEVRKAFYASRKSYGTRRLKKELGNMGIVVSRRKLARIMAENGLVSLYTTKKRKEEKSGCNEEKIENKLDRQFDDKERHNVVVSDLTYVKVKNKWHYICTLIDLYNREIIGYSAGENKTPELVIEAFQSIGSDLRDIDLFHTDRGNEFKNATIENILETFEIDRSLSKKGTPRDNAVAEAAYKTLKTEFIHTMTFTTLDELKLFLMDYINWYNNHRLHSSLGYMSPVEYRMLNKQTIKAERAA